MSVPSAGAAPGAAAEFRLAGVFSRSFGILSRNFGTFLALSAIAAVPSLFYSASLTTRSNATGTSFSYGVTGATGTTAWLVTLFLGTLCEAVVLYGAFQDMRGRPVRAGESLRRGLARFLPLLGLALCVVLGEWLGFILFIVPGLVLAARWFVALPVCVVEQIGPFASLRRSAELTKGNRWKMLGLFILILLAGVGLSFGLRWLLLRVGGAVAATIGAFALSAVFTAVCAVLVVVTYHDLRVAREGVDIERIASVFD